MDLTRDAEQATRRARLAEQVLLDQVQERGIAELREADPKAEPQVAAVWVIDGGGTIADRTWHGRAGQLQLVPAGVAEVLKDAGIVQVRESLLLPAWQRPSIANELRATASELQAAADTLDPTTQPPEPASPEPATREDV